jgi:CBS domain-containing protein
MWILRTLIRICGGRLRGLAVRDGMATNVATLPAHIALSELSPEYLLRGLYRSYPVVRGDTVVGLLSPRQALLLSRDARERTSVQAVMTPLVQGTVIGPGEPLVGALVRMVGSGVRRLYVVEDGRLTGLLSASSVFRRLRLRHAFSS